MTRKEANLFTYLKVLSKVFGAPCFPGWACYQARGKWNPIRQREGEMEEHPAFTGSLAVTPRGDGSIAGPPVALFRYMGSLTCFYHLACGKTGLIY